MIFASPRWDVSTIIARVRASNAIRASHADAAELRRRARELRHIARAVDRGRLSNPRAAAAFTRIADDLGPHDPAPWPAAPTPADRPRNGRRTCWSSSREAAYRDPRVRTRAQHQLRGVPLP